jgi:hypothetical protein
MCILSWLVVLVTVNENASTACFQLVFSDLFSNLWLLCSVHNFVLINGIRNCIMSTCPPLLFFSCLCVRDSVAVVETLSESCK